MYLTLYFTHTLYLTYLQRKEKIDAAKAAKDKKKAEFTAGRVFGVSIHHQYNEISQH